MRTSWLRKASSLPAAWMPPTSAPLDEPAMVMISSPRATSDSITPICASPRAPPAPSTRATFSPLRCPVVAAAVADVMCDRSD